MLTTVKSGMVNSLIVPVPVPSKQPKIVVYLPQELKEEFQKLANTERRSASAMALVLIEEAVKKAKQEGKIP